MLTGGIDLSVGTVGSMAAFIVATQATSQGPAVAIVLALAAAAIAGVVNGIGVGVFKVHPLIMTLGTGLVVLGPDGRLPAGGPQRRHRAPGRDHLARPGARHRLPAEQPDRVHPHRGAILLGLRYTGFGRLLFAVGDNPIASRLAGARIWQVLVALYALSAMLAAVAGLLVAGLVNTATVSLVEVSVLPSVAAAVIGGTSIMGGRGGYSGTIVGALILTVLTALLTALSLQEAGRQMLFGIIIVAVAAAYTRVTGES